jgi:hypothetical protein
MEHTLKAETCVNSKISVTELTSDKEVSIIIFNNNNREEIILTQSELHSLIGTLLHVQSKLKNSNHG